jgi:DNA polymerase I
MLLSTLRTVVMDLECNGLEPTRIWCVVAKDITTGEYFKFRQRKEFLSFAEGVGIWICHNIISFDRVVLKKLLDLEIPLRNIRDTLVMSRLANPVREGHHSLQNWGRILGVPKKPSPDWDRWSPEMMERCVTDVEINELAYYAIKKELIGFSKRSVWNEHQMQEILCEQEKNGFMLDEEYSQKLYVECRSKADAIEREIKANTKYFGIKVKAGNKVVPRYTKNGDLSKVGINFLGIHCTECVGGSFTRITYKEFDLGSPAQIVERLKPWWKPVEPTKSGKSWKISEKNLKTISSKAPKEIHKIKDFTILNNRAKLVNDQWLMSMKEDGRIHGKAMSIGTITNRGSHNNPNMGNVPRINKSEEKGILYGLEGGYGYECRNCFSVPDDRVLLGCDAVGIQMRIFAHWVGDPEYIEEVLNGDVHTKHQRNLGSICKSRDLAKTFIYAWLMGAGDARVGLILGCSTKLGKEAKQNFINKTPGLSKLLQRISLEAQRGYHVTFDGRHIPVKNAHYGMSSYLQGGEQAIMKQANILWQREANEKKLWFKQVAFVHDEWQTECLNKEEAEELGKIQAKALRDTGVLFKLKIPMDGDYKIGKRWNETH